MFGWLIDCWNTLHKRSERGHNSLENPKCCLRRLINRYILRLYQGRNLILLNFFSIPDKGVVVVIGQCEHFAAVAARYIRYILVEVGAVVHSKVGAASELIATNERARQTAPYAQIHDDSSVIIFLRIIYVI